MIFKCTYRSWRKILKDLCLPVELFRAEVGMKDNPAASPTHAACFNLKSKLNFKLKILILSQLESALPVSLRLLQPSSCR
jgi:hypothetical protein